VPSKHPLRDITTSSLKRYKKGVDECWLEEVAEQRPKQGTHKNWDDAGITRWRSGAGQVPSRAWEKYFAGRNVTQKSDTRLVTCNKIRVAVKAPTPQAPIRNC